MNTVFFIIYTVILFGIGFAAGDRAAYSSGYHAGVQSLVDNSPLGPKTGHSVRSNAIQGAIVQPQVPVYRNTTLAERYGEGFIYVARESGNSYWTLLPESKNIPPGCHIEKPVKLICGEDQ